MAPRSCPSSWQRRNADSVAALVRHAIRFAPHPVELLPDRYQYWFPLKFLNWFLLRKTKRKNAWKHREGSVTIAAASASTATARASEATRWGQLVFGIICMVMIANLQYGWTLFVNPIDQKYHWGRAAIQVAFTIFVLTETWLVPFEGYLIDKFGPRIMVCGSGFLVAIA